MERPARDYTIPTSSAELAMEEDLKALTMDVIALAQSLEDYVYEMGEHDEDAYDARGEIFEEDVDYTARGEDCHYIPMFEDEIANYYYSPPLQNQQGRQDDEEQEESSLAKLMAQMIATQTQMMAMQAQQGKYLQLLTSELQQERAARRMLETQVAQHEDNFLSHNKVIEEDEHPELENEEESMEKEVATHQHVKILESHDLSSIPLEDIYPDRKVRKALERLPDDCTLTEFLKFLSQAYHDDTSCAKDERVPEYEDLFSNESCMKEQLDEGHDQGHEDFVEVSVDQFPEKACFKEDSSSKEYFGDLAPKTIIEQQKESTLIKSKSDFEDPFLQPLPQDKFQSFLPFMSCALDESFNNPFHLKEINYNKGLIAQREVPRRLGGREYKWDFKLDKLQSMRCTA